MNRPVKLVCTVDRQMPTFTVHDARLPLLRSHEVRIRVEATSVNPIDTKRARGYGQRLLSIMKAGGPELTLGNDFVGYIIDVGVRVRSFKPGTRVFGVLPTGPMGAHRNELIAPASLVREMPVGIDAPHMAVLPYTFCTLWRSFQALGLNEQTASHRRILVHGGGGALGQMAIQRLSQWGAQVTAVCGTEQMSRCASLGAHEVIDRHAVPLRDLPSDWDATLNFGGWLDDAALVRRLKPDGLGHATTVHPLMDEFDQKGWVRGGLQCGKTWWQAHRMLKERCAHGSYAWVLFQPESAALTDLSELTGSRRLFLEVGPVLPFSLAHEAFSHVAQGSPVRAVLQP